MIRWYSNSKSRRAYAKLRGDDNELDLFAIVALVEFWLVAAGLVLLFVWPWIGGAVLGGALVLAIVAFLISG